MATFLLFGLLFAATAFLEKWSQQDLAGRAIAVDGDSLVMGENRIRLWGLDAPELGQICTRGGASWACGRSARSALRKMVQRGSVVCTTRGVDKYDRWLAECHAGQASSRINLNASMVAEGHAVSYGGYNAEECRARAGKQGLWAGDFQFPQDWREAHRGSLGNGRFGAAERPHSTSILRNIWDRFTVWWNAFQGST